MRIVGCAGLYTEIFHGGANLGYVQKRGGAKLI